MTGGTRRERRGRVDHRDVGPGHPGRVVIDANSTVANGTTTFGGGGVFVGGTNLLIIRNSTVSRNTASQDGADLRRRRWVPDIRNTVVSGTRPPCTAAALLLQRRGPGDGEHHRSGNSAAGTVGGAACTGSGSPAQPPTTAHPGRGGRPNSTFSTNASTTARGGGLVIPSLTGTLLVENSTFNNNTAATSGGGIDMSSGTVIVRNSTLNNNQATGDGGGISVNAGTALSVQNSTLTANSAANGGGISVANTTPVNIQNSTLVGNTATTSGGGVARLVTSVGTVTVDNTVVSNNTAATSGPDIAAWASGHTLNVNFSAVGDTTGLTIVGGNNIAPGTNLQLGALADNGGPTRTMAPGLTSPLLNAGSNARVPAGVTTDQRSGTIDRIFGAAVDIGAVELQPNKVTVNQAPGQADPTNVSPVVFNVEFNAPVADFTLADLQLTGTSAGPWSPSSPGPARATP